MDRSPGKLAAAAAVVGLLAAAVVVPVLSSSSSTSAGGSKPVTKSSSLHARVASRQSPVPRLTESFVSSLDRANCAAPPAAGLDLAVAQGTEVCYQVAVTIPPGTDVHGAQLTLSFVDAHGNPSPEEQFRTGVVTKGAITTHEVPAPLSVVGFTNGGTATLGAGSDPVASVASALGTPQVTDVSSQIGAQFLTLTLGDALGTATHRSSGRPYDVDVAGIPTGVALGSGQTSGSPVYLDASLAYGGSATKPATCASTTCEARVTPQAPALQVTKTYRGSGPYHVVVAVSSGADGGMKAHNVTACEPAASGSAVLAGARKLATCGASSTPIASALTPGASASTLRYVFTPAPACRPSIQNSFCDQIKVTSQTPAKLLGTDTQALPASAALVRSTPGGSVMDAANPAPATLTETVTPTIASGDPPFDPSTGKFVAEGETIAYAITMTNTGATDFSNAEVVDTVPAGLTVASLPTGATQAPGTGGTTVVTFVLGGPLVAGGPHAAGSQVTFNYTATVDATVPSVNPIPSNIVEAGWTITPASGPPVVTAPAAGVSFSPGVKLDVTQATSSVAVTVDTTLDSSCDPAAGGQVLEGNELCYLVSVSPGTLSSARVVLSFVDSAGHSTNSIQFRTCGGTTPTSFKCLSGVPAGSAQPFAVGSGFANTTAASTGAQLASDDTLTLDLGALSSSDPGVDFIKVAAIAPGIARPGAVKLQATLTAANGTGTPAVGDSPLITPVAPDVTVTKTVTSSGVSHPTSAQIGDSLSYVVTIANSSTTSFDAHDVGYCDDLSMSSSDVALSGFSSVITPPGGTPTSPGQNSAGSLPICHGNPALDTAITLPPGFTETVKYTIKFNETPECNGVAATFPDYCNIASATYQIPGTILPTATIGATLTPTLSGRSSLDVVGAPGLKVAMADATVNPPPSPTGFTYATVGQEFDFTLNVAVPEGGLKSLALTAVLPAEMGLDTDSGGALLGSKITAQPDGAGLCTTLPTPCDAGGQAVVSASDAGATGNQVIFSFPTVANSATLGAAGNLQITFPSYVLNTTDNHSFSATTPPSGTPTFSMSYASPDSPSPARAGSAAAPATLTFVDEALQASQVASNAVQDVNDHLTFTDTFTNAGRSPAYGTLLCTGITASTVGTPHLVSGPGSVTVGPTTGCPSSQVEVSPGIIGAATATGLTITPTTVTVQWSVVDTATPPQSDLSVPASYLSFSVASDPTVPQTPGTPALFTRWNPTGTAASSVVGLTAPGISGTSLAPAGTSPQLPLPDVQIGERLTYDVTFDVPVTGTDDTTFDITLDPGLAFATGTGGTAVCTTLSTTSSAGCVTANGLATSGTSTTLPKPTQTAGSNHSPTLDVGLGDLTYPHPSSCPTGAPTPTNPCQATATVTLTYDVYVVDSTAAATGSPGISVPVTSSVTYKTVPDGDASTPLSTSAGNVTVVNPLVGEPTVTTSPPTPVQAEVGVVTPGPALVNFTVALSPPAAGTAYDATATVTVPSGLWIVNGAPETETVAGSPPVTVGVGPPACNTGATCNIGIAVASQTTGALTPLAAPSTAAPTTCRPADDPPAAPAAGDPAIAGRSVVVEVPVLTQAVTFSFDACVDSTTQLFGLSTPPDSHATTTLAWYSVPPSVANWVPLKNGLANQVGAPSPHLFSDGSGQVTAIDFTGTSLTIVGATNTAAGGKTGFTIGDSVTYTATVTLPEAASDLSPSQTPGSPPVATLPSFDVCLFLPTGLTLNTTLGAPTLGSELGNVGTPSVVSPPTDPNCSPAAGTTLYDVQYPAGATINYDAQYLGDSFTQPFSVLVGPDQPALKRGNSEVVQASAALAGRSGTTIASAPSFAILEPDLALGVTLSPPSKWTPGSQVVAKVTLNNGLAGGFSSPAYGDVVRITLPSTDVLDDIRPSVVIGGVAGAPTQILPAWGPGVVVAPDSTATTAGVAHDSVTFSEPAGSIAPGETDTLTISFTLENLLLDQTQVPVTASLVSADSFTNRAGRIYASPGSSVASTHLVPVATAIVTITGPKAAIKAVLTGPLGTVAPGSQPTWTVKLENVGPSPITATDGLLVLLTSSPQLVAPVITNTSPPSPPSPSYNQNSNVWPIALPVFSATNPASVVQLTLTGQVPDTATGSITVKVQASPDVGVVDTNPKLGVATISEPLQAEVAVSAAVKLSGSLFAGQAATYDLTVANAGPSAAGNIVLIDSLPSGTGFVGATGPGFVCNTSLPLSCTYAGPLVAGKSATVALDVRIDSATGSTVTDTESVSTANNTSTHTTASVTDPVLAVAANSAQAQAQAQAAAAAAQAAAASGAVSAGAAGATSVTPTSASTSPTSLAATGAGVVQEFTLGSLLVLVGLALLSGTRRRRRVRRSEHRSPRRGRVSPTKASSLQRQVQDRAGSPGRATPRFGTAKATLSTAVPGAVSGEVPQQAGSLSDRPGEAEQAMGDAPQGLAVETAGPGSVPEALPIGSVPEALPRGSVPGSAPLGESRRSLKVGLLLATVSAGVALWTRHRRRPS